MKVPVYTIEGKRSGEVDLPEEVFGVPMNRDLLHQAVRAYRANARRTLAHTKTRGEVRGGGRKPWRQKGTGRARHGSIRSPIWRGGGVVFGPRRERVFTVAMPQRMRRRAFAVALSAKARDGEIAVLESLRFEEPKTKRAAAALRVLAQEAFRIAPGKKNPTLVIAAAQADEAVARATRNLRYAAVIRAQELSISDLLSARFLIFPKEAVAIFADRVQPRGAPRRLETKRAGRRAAPRQPRRASSRI